MCPDKVQDSIDQQAFLIDKLHRRLPHGDDVACRDTQLDRLVQALLPDVADDDTRANGEDDLQRVEAQAAESKEKDCLGALYLAAAGDCVKGCVYGVCGDGCFARCYSYVALAGDTSWHLGSW